MITEFIAILDELELLECHLETHKEFGWKTFICESDKTVSGIPKRKYFKENEARFSKFNYEYIEIPSDIYIKAEGPEQSIIFTRKNDWEKRRWLHNNIKIDTEWALFNDVDEIFKPELYSQWKSYLDKDVHWLAHFMEDHVGKVNCKTSITAVYRFYKPKFGLIGPKGCKRMHISEGKPIAWHFNSCLSTPEQLRNKVLNRAWYYGVDRPEDIPSIDFFDNLMKEHKNDFFDFIKRVPLNGTIAPLETLPIWMQKNIHLFPVIKNEK